MLTHVHIWESLAQDKAQDCQTPKPCPSCAKLSLTVETQAGTQGEKGSNLPPCLGGMHQEDIATGGVGPEGCV